jgi:putative N6-adenine-specific DNA methylase
MKYVLSTIAWVESIAKKEIELQWWKIEEVIDRLITFSWEINLIPKINLWSRVGNKVYLLLAEEENVTDFDTMFDIIKNISWKKYFKKNFPIVVKTNSVRSDLFAARTIQILWKKAIVKSLVWNDTLVKEDENLEKMEILILIIDNKLRVLLNTSGNALHMRGYRTQAWEAPIKESLAAALVLLSNWRFKENFYDPFCGSWTIAIEAYMIAKNIAPGLKRAFAYEKLGLVNWELSENERAIARTKTYDWEYKISASDIDSEMVELSKENAARAWIAWKINFEQKEFKEYLTKDLSGTLVSNPPYWERLKDENLKSLYNSIDQLFRLNPNLWGWIISSYMEFDDLIKKEDYKKRKLYNGWEKCYFWRRK